MPGQPLATARQTDHQIDLFFVDGRGVVNVMWVVDGGAWQGPVGLTPRGHRRAAVAAGARPGRPMTRSTSSSSTATAWST